MLGGVLCCDGLVADVHLCFTSVVISSATPALHCRGWLLQQKKPKKEKKEKAEKPAAADGEAGEGTEGEPTCVHQLHALVTPQYSNCDWEAALHSH